LLQPGRRRERLAERAAAATFDLWQVAKQTPACHATHRTTTQALSKRIGWFPVSTSRVLCGMHKVESIDQLVERDGYDAVGGR
jgi:hypothetical protein